jgi:hypothetical protein
MISSTLFIPKNASTPPFSEHTHSVSSHARIEYAS